MEDAPDPKREAEPPRRRFLVWLVRSFLSLWVLGTGWVVAAFVRAPSSPRNLTERMLNVGTIDSLAIGQARLVNHGQESIWLVRTGEESLVALSAVCTHLRCVLNWDGEKQQLLCPCHDGSFDTNGNVLGGPPPRALQRYGVETRLGQIYLHL